MKQLVAVGVMTGTSCDGADFAALNVTLSSDNQVIEETLVATKSYRFPKALRARLLEAQDGRTSVRDYGCLCRDFSLWVANKSLNFLGQIKRSNGPFIFGVHGQTIWHEPPVGSPSLKKPGFSIQMIDAALLAQRIGIVTVSNFRQPDLAMGGQGAPLVPFYHWLMAKKISSSPLGVPLPLAVHNIGGISNLTYLGENVAELMAFDTGPGNALIDMAVDQATKGKLRFDKNGRMAKAGRIDWNLVRKISKFSYFKKMPPKSTGREYFNKNFLKQFSSLKGADLVATVTALTAQTMADAYSTFILKKGLKLNGVYLCGGGAKNSYLSLLFSKILNEKSGYPIFVRSMPQEIAPAPYLEAMAFARLSVEALVGRPVSLPRVTGASLAPVGAALYQAANYQELMKLVAFKE